MSTHDFTIDNQGFPAFRSDLNDALQALASTNSSATEPTTTFAGQLWIDTANNLIKLRNEANDGWVSLPVNTTDGSLTGYVETTGGTLTGNLNVQATVTADEITVEGAGNVAPNSNADNIVVDTSGNGGISILTPDNATGELAFGSASDSIGATIRWNHNSSLMTIGTANIGDEISIVSGNFIEAMRIGASGTIATDRATGTVTTDNDLSFDMSATNNFKCTPTGTGTLTFTNITAGQSGNVWLDNSGGHAISAAATTYISAADLSKISAAGVYFMSYYSDGTNVMIAVSDALTSAGA